MIVHQIFILTSIAGGLFSLKLQKEKEGVFRPLYYDEN